MEIEHVAWVSFTAWWTAQQRGRVLGLWSSCYAFGGLVTLGYFFGNVPFIKTNLSLLVVGIIVLSLVPMIIGVVRIRFGRDPGVPRR